MQFVKTLLGIKPEPTVSEIVERDYYLAQVGLLKAYNDLELAKAKVKMFEESVTRLSAHKAQVSSSRVGSA